MSPEEFGDFISSLQNREKKSEPFHDQILEWLREYPDLTGAQVYDWLEEKCNFKEVAENTVRNYINELRDSYHIPKVTTARTYSAVPELPMGQQLQVDFGQTVVKDRVGHNHHLYCIAFVLSNSRYKYVEWLDRPFRCFSRITIKFYIHKHEFHSPKVRKSHFELTVTPSNQEFVIVSLNRRPIID